MVSLTIRLDAKNTVLGMTWPAHYPKGCPPADAMDADGQFYRFVSNDPPQGDDFLSLRQLNPRRTYPDVATECQSCGLSLLQDASDAKRMKSRIPAFRNKLVAIGALRPDCGRVLPTPSRSSTSHHTWWVPEELIDPSPLFVVTTV